MPKPRASVALSKFLDETELSDIFQKVLDVGPVNAQTLRKKVCYVAKVDEDRFDRFLVDRLDLIKKFVHADLLNQLLIQANLRKQAESDPDLGLKVLERIDEDFMPTTKIIGDLERILGKLSDGDLAEIKNQCAAEDSAAAPSSDPER
jgi:hypothetical protein